MSEQENVQTVQAVYAAFGRGDIPGVLDALTDDIEWWIDGPPEIPYAGTQHGREEVAQNFVRLNDTVSFESFVPEEFIAQGNQVVAVGADQRRVRKTGKLVENKWAMVFTLRDGKVSRFRAFESSAAAVAAIRGESLEGLEREDVRSDGTSCHVVSKTFPMHGPDGKICGAISANVDVTTRKEAEDALRRTEEKYRIIFESAVEGIFEAAPDGSFISANPALATIYGYESIEKLMVELKDIGRQLHVDPTKHDEFMRLLKEQESVTDFESQIRRPDNSVIWVALSARAMRDASGKLLHYDGTVEDITKRKVAEERLLRHAYHDKLTGLPDRALFMDRLGQALLRRQRQENYWFAVLFMDLDRFKIVNDSLGHMVGDQLLVSVARKLEACVRPGDTVARLGGDEFAMLLDDVNGIADATQVAERIQKRLTMPLTLGGQEVFTNASLGIALSSKAYDRPEDLLRDADMAMYRAKTSGRACYAVFDTAMHNHGKSILQLESDLRRALERREFRVEYQPIVSLATGRIAGFEALIRWEHPRRGVVSPGEFVPLAEETGLLILMDRWVLGEATRQMRAWQSQLALDALMTISVNLSTKQFSQLDLVEQITKILRRSGLEPRYLKLEITESVLMANPESATKLLMQLRDMGIKLSLDDFGTGYSSLSYLHNFPFNSLKIDRSFVSQMDVAEKNEEIVRTILSLAHNLNMDVIAEGVETETQLEHLRALRCHYGQGYYFSGALDAASALELIKAKPQW